MDRTIAVGGQKYMRGRKKCLKKRKRIYFCFLMHIFLFLKLFSENFDKEDTEY